MTLRSPRIRKGTVIVIGRALKRLILIGFSLQLVFASSEKSEEGATPESNQSTPAKTKKPPATFQNIRFEEVWTSDSNDSSLKYIPLNDSGTSFLSLGGQIRIRGESWNNFGFLDAPGRSDTFGLLRIRLHADFYLGPHVRFFVEGKSAQSSGRDLPGGNRTLDIDTIDIQNLIVDLKAPISSDGSVFFRLGRQELQFGKQRLVSLSTGSTPGRGISTRFGPSDGSGPGESMVSGESKSEYRNTASIHTTPGATSSEPISAARPASGTSSPISTGSAWNEMRRPSVE